MQDMRKMFEQSGAILNGHFKLTSGKHSPMFLQCSQLMKNPEYMEIAGKELASRFADCKPEVVVGPAMGGVIISYVVAKHLGCTAMYAEKDNGQMRFRRGFKLEPGTKVLVVEDAISTGGSVKKVLSALEPLNVDIVGIGVLVDRSGGSVKLHENQHALLQLNVPAYDPEECPLCSEAKPLTHPKDLGM